ncbi:MAG: hypothetical protein O7G85_05960 [Planctomycetota bacterium]|nr:hypothetical protein [Planctomycetota bacterium]
MAEPTRRIILDGVEFSQIFRFPSLLGSCTAAFQPARLLLALIMVMAVVTFGRFWDGATEPNVNPAGLLAGSWSIEDAQSIQPMLQEAMMTSYALGSEVPQPPETWPTLHPGQVLESLRLGYRTRTSESQRETDSDEAFLATYAAVSQDAPLHVYEATAAQLKHGFLRIVEGAMTLTSSEVLDGFKDLVARLPVALWTGHKAFLISLTLVMLLVYIFGGGALCRMSACRFAGGRRPGLDEAVDFALVHWIRIGIALMLPLILMALLGAVIAGFGALMMAPVLDWAGGILYGFILLIGFALAFIMFGYATGFGMILPAVASENCDAPDAVQKSLAFIYQKPLHLLGYLCVSLISVLVGYLVVSLFAMVTLNVTASLFGWSSQPALDGLGGITWPGLEQREPSPWISGISSSSLMFWQSLVIGLVWAYIVSLLCDLSTRLFLLMRFSCDEQSIEEIWWPGMVPGTIGPQPTNEFEIRQDEA